MGDVLLPQLEQKPLFDLYHWDRAWDDPLNQPAGSVALPVFVCPSAPSGRLNTDGRQTYGPCDYSPIANVDEHLVATGLLAPWNGNREGVMAYGVGYRIADTTDGTSATVLVAETAGRPQLWRKGKLVGSSLLAGWATVNNRTPINLDGFSPDGMTEWGPCAVNCNNGHEVYAFHSGGANAVFADGRVVFVRESVSIRVLAAMTTLAGGEVVADGDL